MRKNYCRGSFSNVNKAPSSNAVRLRLKAPSSVQEMLPILNAERLPPPSRSLMAWSASYLE